MLSALTYISYFFLLLTEITLNRLLRSKSSDQPNADKKSLSLIWVTIIVVVTLSVYIARASYLPIYSNPEWQYAGIAIIFTGIIIRLYVVYSLGRFFTVDVTIRQNHQLKKDGVYKYLRHPSYSALLLSFMGMGWTFNNWLSLVLLVTAVLIVLIKRINIEENVLMEHFGEEYSTYKKTTKRLIPFIY